MKKQNNNIHFTPIYFNNSLQSLPSTNHGFSIQTQVNPNSNPLSYFKFQFHLIMLLFLRLFIADSSSKGMMFSVSQPNLLANKKRKFILSSTVNKRSDGSVGLDWAPFPVEMTGVSVMVPSPSGSKLLIVRNPEGDGGCKFEIWSNSCLENEFSVPQSKHGSVYADGW